MKYFILTIFCLFAATSSAQSLEEARKMFSNGEYEKAKPTFNRLLKSQPNNSNYNYWYGVCCINTGDIEEAIKPLEFAHKRKVPNATLYLGQAYDQLYRFEEAVTIYESYIEELTKKRQSTESVQKVLEKSRISARMLKGVEEVSVIDSFVVSKKDFLKAYKLSEESGRLYSYNEFFNSQLSTLNPQLSTVYETELANKIYYSELGEDSTLNILSRNKMLNEWSKPLPLPESINKSANTNYPFVLTDGVTIYYASDGEGSMGGYDIFVTRYNSSTESYLNPDNVGMPFNSPFNDYMYAIDEYNELGWFASDRYQPEDKVCIYVFIPNTSKHTYNYESMDAKRMRQLAQLHSIKDTWKNKTEVDAAKQRLEAAIHQKPQKEKEYDFEFIINDKFTYYELNNFTSPQAKELFRKYQQMEKDYRQQKEKLDAQRKWYAEAKQLDKEKSAPAIIDLEKRVLEMCNELDILATDIRNKEINNIKK
ncbi:tetratricopeptide repeat protein [Bacteroides sp. 224]|uniref:tetratricopeptide repeat protein n=1 Tax=Bacteroides sp. 224 TaxID=2302936 RepID=UPI0013D2DBF1|nr:tetratricopeptide repeat protein [Bacteroides sp. 224]NDV65917.1 hypothetical protein [Bacteroides sp. 224]